MKSDLISCTLLIEHTEYSEVDTPHKAQGAETSGQVQILEDCVSFTGTSLTCQRPVQIHFH